MSLVPGKGGLARAFALGCFAALCILTSTHAADEPAPPSSRSGAAPRRVSGDVLVPAIRRRVDSAVDKGLAFLAANQEADGSFTAPPAGQPGVTSLGILAFLARGHMPGHGRYGRQLDSAVKFVLSTQNEDGLFTYQEPSGSHQYLRASHAAMYNHAISGLMLAEVYGMTRSNDSERIRDSIQRAIQFAYEYHPQPKRFPNERGAWRYLRRYGLNDADLSITSWEVMFLRGCRNAGFEIEAKRIDLALEYIVDCYDPQEHTFVYEIVEEEPEFNRPRAMAGAGILALSLSGRHDSDMARAAGDWLLERPFDQYDHPIRGEQWHVYSAFYCSQAMFQLGGKYWEEFYPQLCMTLIADQDGDGAWRPEDGNDRHFGDSYITAMTTLSLCPPYQLLPIFQR